MSQTEANFRELIEQAGAEFVAVRGESVFFLDPVSGKSLSLYTWACRSLADVELALKSAREKIWSSNLGVQDEGALWLGVKRIQRVATLHG